MIALPVDAIRDAIRAGDWDAAHALIATHEAQLRETFETGTDAEKGCREAWLELLAAQRALIEELSAARDDASRSLERLGRDRRAVSAYLSDAE